MRTKTLFYELLRIGIHPVSYGDTHVVVTAMHNRPDLRVTMNENETYTLQRMVYTDRGRLEKVKELWPPVPSLDAIAVLTAVQVDTDRRQLKSSTS